MRRGAIVVVIIGVALLLGSYVVYTQRVVQQLRKEAARTGLMYGEVYRALADTTADPTSVFLDLAQNILESKVPVIVTDPAGVPRFVANVPGVDSAGDPRAREWVARLDAQNPPVMSTDSATIVHIGHTPLVRGLRVIPALQAGTLALLLLAGVYVLRTRANADRERVWAGMARESAHQLGTPLSSLSGWLELLREREADELTLGAVRHMEGDLERLERVAHRFERIGRPPRTEAVDVSDVVTQVVAYFAARVPTLAHPIALRAEREDGALTVPGDRVLLEWAVESLVKNAIDALAGRGGTVVVSVAPVAGSAVRVRVADDGPGIQRELRAKIFSAGFTTKERGWGIGLALTKRIVEESHHGQLRLAPSDRGAVFDVILPG